MGKNEIITKCKTMRVMNHINDLDDDVNDKIISWSFETISGNVR